MSDTHIPKALREKVTAQARRRCGYCLTQEAVVGAPMEIDHLIPEALGGRTEEENLWLACSSCNGSRGYRIVGIDPLTGELVRLFNPRQQIWFEHFRWSADFARIVGSTPIGRGTVITLNLNRPLLVQARIAWVAVGWHPPKD